MRQLPENANELECGFSISDGLFARHGFVRTVGDGIAARTQLLYGGCDLWAEMRILGDSELDLGGVCNDEGAYELPHTRPG